MSSLPVFFPVPVTDAVSGPYQPLYGVHISRMGRLHAHRVAKQGWVKSYSSYWLSSSNWLYSTSYTAMLHLLPSSTVIIMLTALLTLLTSYLPPSYGLAVHDFLSSLFYPPTLCKSELSSLLLVKSETLYLNLYFHLWTWTLTHLIEVSRHLQP